MDFLLELLTELFIEVPFEAAMESKRVKPWVKRLLIGIVGGAVAALFWLCTVNVLSSGEAEAWQAIVLLLLSVGWTLLILWACFKGFRHFTKE